MVYAYTMRTTDTPLLTSALGVRPRELLSIVGGGGKTGALQLLAREARAGVGAAAGAGAGAQPGGPHHRVLATTTTGMFLAQLEAVGPVAMWGTREGFLAALADATRGDAPKAAAYAPVANSKVQGLPVEWVDDAWSAGVADRIYVEADGSRGLSLKIFGPHEPAVPPATTLIVQVAGLDALGLPLDAAHVHRAELLATLGGANGLPRGAESGAPVTPAVFAGLLRAQLRTLRARWPAARIVTLLNKADDAAGRTAGMQIAGELLECPEVSAPFTPRPEAVVVGSVQRGGFTRCVRGAPLVTAIVLAAGRARRMGSQKLLLPVDGRPMIERVVEAAMGSTAVETVVVVGCEADQVRAALTGYPARIVENAGYQLGMSTSLRAGLAAARPDCEAAIFILGDQPFVASSLIDEVIARHARSGSPIVRPAVDGKPSHPVLMGAALFSEIMALEGDLGAREILARHSREVDLLAVADPLFALDLDTPEDYESARGPAG